MKLYYFLNQVLIKPKIFILSSTFYQIKLIKSLKILLNDDLTILFLFNLIYYDVYI
jgi:hypothetical protein